MNRAPKPDPTRSTKFGQFLQEQHDLQHNFNLHQAHVLTLMQSTIQKLGPSV